jgi:competence protein ComEC
MTVDDRMRCATSNQVHAAVRLLCLGLSWRESRVACPTNRIGHADAYLVPHHGNADTAIPAVISATSPRVAILNNGVTKGGNAAGFDALRSAMIIEDVWQLHQTRNQGAVNFPEMFTANQDEGEKRRWGLA